MQGDFLTIETAKKIEKLEKDNKRLSDIIAKFDLEINKQYQIIKESYSYLKINFSSDNVHVIKLTNLLKGGLKQINDSDHV